MALLNVQMRESIHVMVTAIDVCEDDDVEYVEINAIMWVGLEE